MTPRAKIASLAAAAALTAGLASGVVRVGPDPDDPPTTCTDEWNPYAKQCDPPSSATCRDAWDLFSIEFPETANDAAIRQSFIDSCLDS